MKLHGAISNPFSKDEGLRAETTLISNTDTSSSLNFSLPLLLSVLMESLFPHHELHPRCHMSLEHDCCSIAPLIQPIITEDHVGNSFQEREKNICKSERCIIHSRSVHFFHVFLPQLATNGQTRRKQTKCLKKNVTRNAFPETYFMYNYSLLLSVPEAPLFRNNTGGAQMSDPVLQLLKLGFLVCFLVVF